MATKQLKELKNLSTAELSTRVRETENQLFQLRMKQVTGQLTDTASLWKLRKQVARIKTLQSAAGNTAAPKEAVVAKAAKAKKAPKAAAAKASK